MLNTYVQGYRDLRSMIEAVKAVGVACHYIIQHSTSRVVYQTFDTNHVCHLIRELLPIPCCFITCHFRPLWFLTFRLCSPHSAFDTTLTSRNEQHESLTMCSLSSKKCPTNSCCPIRGSTGTCTRMITKRCNTIEVLQNLRVIPI